MMPSPKGRRRAKHWKAERLPRLERHQQVKPLNAMSVWTRRQPWTVAGAVHIGCVRLAFTIGSATVHLVPRVGRSLSPSLRGDEESL
jgi:hypothetical protein